MGGQPMVRIPPRRSRLFGILLGSVLGVIVALLTALGTGSAIIHGPFLPQDFILVLLLVAAIVIIPYLAVFALWALVRLMLNLPAVVLTPSGIINHSIVFHVVLPWDQIDSFTRFKPGTPAYKVNAILVVFKDDRQVYAMQQPLTRLLLRVFAVMVPTNISTAMTAPTREKVWTELQRYVRAKVPDDHITFTTA
jgi:hypothetical protein